MNREERSRHLLSQHWQVIESAAERVGIFDKPSGKTWRDMVSEIVSREFDLSTPINEDPMAAKDSGPIEPAAPPVVLPDIVQTSGPAQAGVVTADYAFIQGADGLYCKACSIQIRKDVNQQLICPCPDEAVRASCPRPVPPKVEKTVAKETAK